MICQNGSKLTVTQTHLHSMHLYVLISNRNSLKAERCNPTKQDVYKRSTYSGKEKDQGNHEN